MTGMVVTVWEELAVMETVIQIVIFIALILGGMLGWIVALNWAITEKSQVVNFRREVSRLLTQG